MKAKKKPRKLKQVIAVRHGEFADYTMNLNEEGESQMRALAERLKKLVRKGYTVEVFSSPNARAMQSAEIISKPFGISSVRCEALKSDEYGDGQEKMKALLSLWKGGDVIIAVTHYESPSGIIHAFSLKHFSKPVKCAESEKGDGLMLCMKTGRVTAGLLA